MISDSELLARLVASARDGVADIDAANEAEGRALAEISAATRFMAAALSYLVLRKHIAGNTIKTATPIIARRHNLDEATAALVCNGCYDGARRLALEKYKKLLDSEIAQELALLRQCSSERDGSSSERDGRSDETN